MRENGTARSTVDSPPKDPSVRKKRGRIKFGLKVVVSAALITWIVLRTDMGEVFRGIAGARIEFVVLALALNVVGWTISVTRWSVLLGAKNVRPGFLPLLQSYLSALFFNVLLPSTVGGDSVRAYDSWRFGAGKAGAVAVIGVDRLAGILALLGLALLALLLAPAIVEELPMLPLWLGIAVLGIVGLVALPLLPPTPAWKVVRPLGAWIPTPIRRMLDKLSAAIREFGSTPKRLYLAFGLSVALQLNVILHFFLISYALDLPIPLLNFFVLIPVALAIMALPISVNAIGIRENVFAFLFGLYGVSTAAAVSFAWIAFGLVLAQGLIGAVVYSLRKAPAGPPSGEGASHRRNRRP